MLGSGKWEGYTIEGGSPDCSHDNVVEGVDDEGELLEPPCDVCTDCGAKIY